MSIARKAAICAVTVGVPPSRTAQERSPTRAARMTSVADLNDHIGPSHAAVPRMGSKAVRVRRGQSAPSAVEGVELRGDIRYICHDPLFHAVSGPPPDTPDNTLRVRLAFAGP